MYQAEEVEKLIKDVHKDVGHYGADVVWNAMKERYYIPGIKEQVKEELASCIQCQLFTTPKAKL